MGGGRDSIKNKVQSFGFFALSARPARRGGPEGQGGGFDSPFFAARRGGRLQKPERCASGGSLFRPLDAVAAAALDPKEEVAAFKGRKKQ